MPAASFTPLALLLVLACGCARATTDASSSTAAPAAAGPAAGKATANANANPLSIDAVMRRARYAFRSDATSGALKGGGDAYDAKVRADGSIALTRSRRASDTLILSTALPLRAGATPVREQDGSIRIARENCVERFQNSAHGVEQSFTFGRAPAGDDDLHLSISTSGMHLATTTAGGVHFFGSAAGTRFRYGAATWVDAAGTRTPVRMAATEQGVTLSVSRQLLASSAYPATLDPLVGPESDIDTPVAVRAEAQSRANVAASGSQFLAVWLDQTAVGVSEDSGTVDLYAARIDPKTNTVLASDAAGVYLATEQVQIAPAQATDPDPAALAVGSDGSDFFVVVDSNDQLLGLRVHGDTAQPYGEDGVGVPIGHSASQAGAVGYSGGMYIVEWTDATFVRAARVDPATGLTPDVGGVILAPEADGGATPIEQGQGLACDVAQCLFTWYDYAQGQPHFSRYDPATGKPIPSDAAGPVMPTLPKTDLPYALTSIGNGLYVMATGPEYYANPTPGAATLRIFDSATATFAAATKVVTYPAANSTFYLTYDGAKVIAAWENTDTQTATLETVDPTTLALGGTGVATLDAIDPVSLFHIAALDGVTEIVGTAYGSDVTAFGASDVTVDIQYAETSSFVSATRKTPGPMGTPLTSTENGESFPAMAGSSAGALVAWVDNRGVFPIPYAARLDTSGNVLPSDAAGIVLSTEPISYGGPAVAFDGSGYLVVWNQRDDTTDKQDVIGARIALATGAITPMPPFSAPVGLLGPNLVFDGTNYAIVGTTSADVVLDVISPTTLMSTGVSLEFTPASNRGGVVLDASIAYGASTYLVTWTGQLFEAENTPPFVEAVRVSLDGKILPSDGTGLALSTAGTSQSTPFAAFSHGTFLVAWKDLRTSRSSFDVFGRLVPPSGALPAVDDLAIGTTEGPAYTAADDQFQHPAVIDPGDGLNFQVAWSGAGGVFGSLVSYAGVVRQATPFTFSDLPGDDQTPALATVAPGAMVLAYSRRDPAAGSYRVRTRTVSTGATSGTCTSDDQCATRNCQDGFCCDRPCDGSCETCSATPGTCTTVASAIDTDSCSGNKICDARGVCGSVNGQACVAAANCASGNCADGVCCNTSCNGGCDVCDSVLTPGICSVVAAGATGASPSCLPYLCDGSGHDCPIACLADTDCARSEACVKGACQIVAGASCSGEHTVALPDGTTEDCAPYACLGSACLTSCKSIKDCADGSDCDANGKCVAPVAASMASGCDSAGSNGQKVDWTWLTGIAGSLAFVGRRRGRRDTRDAGTAAKGGAS